jgi:hypothetical protein
MGAPELADNALSYEKRHNHHYTYGTGAGQFVCNQFVIAIIRESLDPSFPMILADDFDKNGHFVKVDMPQKGDLVHFPGHIGIVTDPDHGEFIGAQTKHGVGTANFKSGYWHGEYGGKVADYFLRWVH